LKDNGLVGSGKRLNPAGERSTTGNDPETKKAKVAQNDLVVVGS